MFNSSNIPLTIPTIVLYPPIYLPAPSETPNITGELFSCAVNNIALVHSKLFILNWPTAYLPSLALFNISFAETNIVKTSIIKLNLKFCYSFDFIYYLLNSKIYPSINIITFMEKKYIVNCNNLKLKV